MAEFIELRAEEWLPEVEQMEKNGIFNSEEIRSIITKKRELEYKVHRNNKSKEDYLKFIQFEVDLYRLVKARRNKMNIHTNKGSIEGVQTVRIGKLFKQLIYRYQEDIKLWMSFFKYCQEAALQKMGSQMLVRMLQVHADKDDLWSFAAKWDYEELNSVESARHFLLKGLRHHPESELLYTELFKLELESASKKKLDKNDKSENQYKEDSNPEKELKLAKTVCDNALSKLDNVNFKVHMLNMACDYPDTKDIQNKIFENIMKNHSEEEVTWDTMAKREFQGLPYEDPQKEKNGESMEVEHEEEAESKTLKERILKSVHVYESAIEKLNTTKMWSFYLSHLIELNKNITLSSLAVFKSKLLRNSLEAAFNAGRLEEKFYLIWIELLQESGGKSKKQAEILAKATEEYPRSVQLWHARLKFHLSRDQEKTGMAVFKEASEKLRDLKALPIWKLVIQYYQSKSSPKIEEIFRSGLERGGELALRLKPLYLRWMALSKGIGCAKSLFESPEMLHPPCLELVNEMISLEMMQPDINKKGIRRCHELACNLIGEKNIDVWMNYVEFEIKYGDGDGPYRIHMRAVRTLNSELVDEFVSRYNQFMRN